MVYFLSSIHFSEHFHIAKRLNAHGFLKKKNKISNWRQRKKRRAIQETMDPRLAAEERVFGGRVACVTLNYLACYSTMLCICLELKGLDCFHLCSFL